MVCKRCNKPAVIMKWSSQGKLHPSAILILFKSSWFHFHLFVVLSLCELGTTFELKNVLWCCRNSAAAGQGESLCSARITAWETRTGTNIAGFHFRAQQSNLDYAKLCKWSDQGKRWFLSNVTVVNNRGESNALLSKVGCWPAQRTKQSKQHGQLIYTSIPPRENDDNEEIICHLRRPQMTHSAHIKQWTYSIKCAANK